MFLSYPSEKCKIYNIYDNTNEYTKPEGNSFYLLLSVSNNVTL